MMALLSPRIWAAVLVALALAAGGWKAYLMGENTVQTKWNAEKLQTTQAALTADIAARAKEQALQTKVRKVSNDYITEKTRRAADAVVADGKLRDLQADLDSVATSDSSATGRTDDPAITVARQCASSLVLLDEYAQGLAGQTIALQNYASSVCVSKQ